MHEIPSGSPRSLPRRRFLAGAAAALAAPWIAPSAAGTGLPATAGGRVGFGATPPSERITIGGIGIGGRGTNHVDAFLSFGDCQVVAVCDPYESKREGARKRIEAHYARRSGETYKGCLATADFREIVERPDIDAVFIASTENWHALHAAGAVRGGKDVYCEKALTLTHAEGVAVVDAVRRHARVLQVGLQQRSDRNFRFACELARNGYLGKLRAVKVAVPGGQVLPVAKPVPVPPGIDYEMWLGPAPSRPYNEQVCTFNWYFVSDYCRGWIQSWGIHHMDIAQWGLPALVEGKIEVEGLALFPTRGLADTSVSWKVDLKASNGVMVTFTDEGQMPHGVRFEGEKGWVHVVRGGIQAEPASLLAVRLRPSDEHLYESGDHHRNFVECIRSRRDPVCPVEAGHKANVLTIVSDIATRLGRKLVWVWEAERFEGDEAANRMLRRTMRAPWTL
jgi:predicted dehydrogenase